MVRCIIGVNARMVHFRAFIVGLAPLPERARIVFERIVFVITDEFRVGANETAIENPSREPLVVVAFDCLEVPDGNPGLLGYIA
jgi:hypothetical protein